MEFETHGKPFVLSRNGRTYFVGSDRRGMQTVINLDNVTQIEFSYCGAIPEGDLELIAMIKAGAGSTRALSGIDAETLRDYFTGMLEPSEKTSERFFDGTVLVGV